MITGHLTSPEARLHTQLLQIWSLVLGTGISSIDDDFFERGGDSLLATDLLLEIEKRIGRSLPDSILFEASTVRRLTEALLSAPEQGRKTVFPVAQVGGQSPLFFFHGDWTNNGFYLKKFCAALGVDQPVIAVAPHGIRGESIPETLEKMAAERLPQILTVQPQGPYRLGGHCVGGMVAFETARLLIGRGHQIELLVMIDPIWTGAGQPWPKLQTSDPGRDGQDGSGQPPSSAEVVSPLPDVVPTPQTWEQYGAALSTYAPAPLSVPIVIFSSEFNGRPWRDVSSDFKLIEAPGNHYDWVTTKSNDFADLYRRELRRIAIQNPART